MGRILVALGLAVGAMALFVGLVIPFSGWAERVLIGVFGGLFLFALVKGFVHVRAGRVDSHREWMIRAFAIALAIATQRLIFVPSLFVAGVADPTNGRIVTLARGVVGGARRALLAGGGLDPPHPEMWGPRSKRGEGLPRADAGKPMMPTREEER